MNAFSVDLPGDGQNAGGQGAQNTHLDLSKMSNLTHPYERVPAFIFVHLKHLL